MAEIAPAHAVSRGEATPYGVSFDPLAALAHGLCCLQHILRCAVVGADGLEPPTLSV